MFEFLRRVSKNAISRLTKGGDETSLMKNDLVLEPVPKDTRPKNLASYVYDNFTPTRGAILTTQNELIRLGKRMPGPLFHLAGVYWPVIESLNKLTLITGRPGSGKTTMMRMTMGSASSMFNILPEMSGRGLIPGKGNLRWLVIDPTDSYLPFLYQILPSDVPIIRTSPNDICSSRWDIAKDVTSETDILLLESAMFPDSLFKNSSDGFWLREARSVFGDVIRVFSDRGSDWQFADAIVPLVYPIFLKPLLVQSNRTRHNVSHRLRGKLGRDITATAASVIRNMSVAAALWKQSQNTFSIADFLANRSVMHLSYQPSMIPAMSGIANALTHMLVIKAMERNDQFDFTTLWLDEARYLSDLAGLDDLVARGRGAGLGAIVSAQGLPGLVSKWNDIRVREFRDLINTWITLSAGDETAEAFSKLVGKIEGIQRSWSNSETESESISFPVPLNPILSFLEGMAKDTPPVKPTYTHSLTTGSSESFQMTTRDAVLPSEITGLPLITQDSPIIQGFAFSPNTGCFRFSSTFLPYFESLIDPPFSITPTHGFQSQILEPWNIDDVTRLGLDPTPQLIEAIKKSSVMTP